MNLNFSDGLLENRIAKGVRLRQSYIRIAKRAAMMAGRHAHAKSSTATVGSCASCAPGLAG